jgi:hypothetical protein
MERALQLAHGRYLSYQLLWVGCGKSDTVNIYLVKYEDYTIINKKSK